MQNIRYVKFKIFKNESLKTEVLIVQYGSQKLVLTGLVYRDPKTLTGRFSVASKKKKKSP